MRYPVVLPVLFLLGVLASLYISALTMEPRYGNARSSTSLEIGAKVYTERCVLCHGIRGAGNGRLPDKIADYPNTDLQVVTRTETRKEIRKAIVHGGTKGKMSEFMPPMGNDLSWIETESVVDFVQLLRKDRQAAWKLLDVSEHASGTASLKVGREVFAARCVLCHGKYGEGDGRMAVLIKDPGPANLPKSRMNEDELRMIVTHGGEKVGRSSQMPAWGPHLSETEIDSLIIFLKDMRR